MYPLSNLKQIKDENLQQELDELQTKTAELERYRNFAEVDDLLEESKNIIASEKNVEVIAQSSKKIDSIMKLLTQPIQEKMNQLIFLKNLIEAYCDQTEVQSLNSTLAIQEKKLKIEITKKIIDSQEIKNQFFKIDAICHKNLKKIIGKIKQRLLELEKSCDDRYKAYLNNQLEIISLSEKEINEKVTEMPACFATIKFVIESINEFESSHKLFIHLIHSFNSSKEYYQKLTDILFNSAVITLCKRGLEIQIKLLNNNFSKFDPRSQLLEDLNTDLQSLNQETKQLIKLSSEELKLKHNNLMNLVKNSNEALTAHNKKLSYSSTQIAMNKSIAIKLIKDKIDLLLNTEINFEDNASSQAVIDKISELKQTIKDAKGILSEYRGISFLRCVATLWGGGKVTSQGLVNTLEEQLTDFPSNKTRLSPSIKTC